MTKRKDLPKRVYIKHGAYYFVTPANKWVRLCAVTEGTPTMLRALAALLNSEVTGELLPAVITRWVESKIEAGEWGDSQREDVERAANLIASEFRAIAPAQVTAPLAVRFLKRFLKQPRTYNLYRSILRQVISFAALEGLRDGHNPIDDVPLRKIKKRIRVVTQDELDLMVRGFMKAKRGGKAHVLMLALCIKTGQRISDVLELRAQHCTAAGIEVDQGKTDAPLLIEWDDELRAIVDQCFEGRDRIGPLLVQSTGKPYTYGGVRSAWVRSMARNGIEDLHIHDLRGEAGARIADMMGSYSAQLLLGHSSVKMTEDYIRGKVRKVAKAAPLRKAV